LQDKWSTTIVKELMDVAGSPSWQKWKEESSTSGLPVVPGEEREGHKTAKKPQRISRWKKPSSTKLESPMVQNVGAKPEVSQTSNASRPKVGAAAVLP
jgi:small subunit ribosomal protein S25